MILIHSTLFWTHIVFGSLALILLWVPLFTEKGKLNHVKYGRYYKTSMYIVAAAGMLMSMLVIYAPLEIKVEFADHEFAEKIAQNLRVFWGFLALLAILSFVSTRHGIKVLKVKDNRESLRSFNYLFPIIMLLLGGILYIYLGAVNKHALHFIFGILSIVVAAGLLKYCLAKTVAKRAWILEHISAIIGSGIGAYTAFLTFGSRSLLDLGNFQVIIWIAPGVIGATASYILCKKYKKLFQVSPKIEPV